MSTPLHGDAFEPAAKFGNSRPCPRDCGLAVTVPDVRRTRYELADERLGYARDDRRRLRPPFMPMPGAGMGN
ncbi:hypothetical protein FFZ77_19225 [Streptomyces katsurahamanus]|uniref:Uncharacterized protein n=1 Tax=Streptomyces katsurahamanus TaxID=2577098 RepID=A0ABW9NWL2_9ACTN|nr:hypothetical protein [Streptomyces katsurahamanus]